MQTRLGNQVETLPQDQEERYRVLFTKARIPMLLVDPGDGAIVEANQAAADYYGYALDQLLEMSIADLNTYSPEQIREEMSCAEQDKRNHFYFRHRLASGEIRDVEVHSGPLTIDGRRLLYSVVHDITERREAERRLRESEARFRHIMEHAPLGIAVTDPAGRFLQVNQAMCDIVGFSREELQGLAIGDITHPDDGLISQQRMQSLIDGQGSVAKYEKRYLHKDRRHIWVQVSTTLERDAAGAPLYFIHLAEDIGKRKEAEQRISFLAHHDRLTELPNRDLFLDRLSSSISRARRNGKRMALFFLDLDGFKAINDNYGHEAGDIVLQAVSAQLRACVRESDTVARLGGDEFAIIFDEIAETTALAAVAAKIIQRVAEPIRLHAKLECTVGISIGIAAYPENGVEIDRLMSAADDAMYASKRHGKNTYTFFQGAAQGYASNRPWIVLDEGHLLGEPEIDREHLELARKLNELNDAVRSNFSPEVVARLFDELIAYAESHFAIEERLMEKYAYPERGVHQHEHQRLIEEAYYLKAKLAQGGELLVLQSLKDWLLAHTMHVDKPFVEYLQRHGVGRQ